MSRQINNYEQNKLDGWDLAIAEGKKQLKVWRSKVARLMASIQTFEEAKNEGRPWPEGISSVDRNTETSPVAEQ
jgi:hypothetical protein